MRAIRRKVGGGDDVVVDERVQAIDVGGDGACRLDRLGRRRGGLGVAEGVEGLAGLVEGGFELVEDAGAYKLVRQAGGGGAGHADSCGDVCPLDTAQMRQVHALLGDRIGKGNRGLDLLLQVMPTPNVLFASEMIGAVRGIDPTTGFNYDDTKRYIEASTILSAEDKFKVYEGNARRVFPRLDAALQQKGL